MKTDKVSDYLRRCDFISCVCGAASNSAVECLDFTLLTLLTVVGLKLDHCIKLSRVFSSIFAARII